MNKHGQTIMLSVLFALFILIFGFLFINFLKNDVDTSRTGLNCSSDTISDGTKVTCLFVDSALPYWIMLGLSLAGGTIFNRLLV